jgi:hypothetical protein
MMNFFSSPCRSWRAKTQARLSASSRALAAAQAEIAALKSLTEKMNGELAQLKQKLQEVEAGTSCDCRGRTGTAGRPNLDGLSCAPGN